MTRSTSPWRWIPGAGASWSGRATVAAAAIVFLVLAIAGSRGHRRARREAELQDMVFCRDQLQQALDARRSEASGPRPKGSTADVSASSRAVTDWAAQLEPRLASFGSRYAPVTDSEDIELRSSAAVLSIARGRFAEALEAIRGLDERLSSAGSAARDRKMAVLRLRGDAHFDSGNWPAALDSYQQVLVELPERLDVAERAAACLSSLGRTDSALRAYAQVANRLQERGSRLLSQLNPGSAAQDLNKAITIRIWLVDQGRLELSADLARSFSSCAAALLEMRNLEYAKAYLAQALELQARLVQSGQRADLARELARNHALYADVLLQAKDVEGATLHLDRAIDLEGRLVNEGQADPRRSLAANLARRGSVRGARGQAAAAAQDFEKAAEVFAGSGDLAEAIAWQRRAVDAAEGDARKAAQLRLDRLLSSERGEGSSNKG